MEGDLVEVGCIDKAHGLRGEVVVRLVTNRIERLAPGSVLRTPGGTLVVGSSRPHQHRFVVSFEGVVDRAAAERLRGVVLLAEPIDDPHETWVRDLIGKVVVEVDGTERGVVSSVQDNPAADLLVLASGALVPLTFVVDVTDERIVVEVPDGLFELAGG